MISLIPWWAWLIVGAIVLNALLAIALLISDRRSARSVAQSRHHLRMLAWRKGILPAYEAHQAFEEE